MVKAPYRCSGSLTLVLVRQIQENNLANMDDIFGIQRAFDIKQPLAELEETEN